MRVLLLLVFLLVLGQAASAQMSSVSAGALRAPAVDFRFQSPTSLVAPSLENSHALSVPDSAISYFDPSLPSYDWIAGGSYSPLVVPVFGERMRLSSAGGFVDSISVQIDSSQADTIAVELFPVVTAPNGFLVIDINATALYGRAIILGSTIHGPTRVTVPFPHIAVPQDFVVAFSPNIDYVHFVYKGLYLHADLEPTRARTPENTHSDFVGTYNGQVFSNALDSIFIPNGMTSLVFTNLAVTAFVSVEGASVASQSPRSVRVYPNPCKDILHVDVPDQAGQWDFTLFDLLGNRVEVRSGRGPVEVNLSQLPPGRYESVLRTEQRDCVAPVVLQR